MIYVRPLSCEEEGHLQDVARCSRDGTHVRRAHIVLASATRMSVPEVARTLLLNEDHVRRVIQAFNEQGLAALASENKGGRPRHLRAAAADRPARPQATAKGRLPLQPVVVE